MGKKIRITVNGKTYESVSAFCKEYGLNVYSVLHRLGKGESIEDIVGTVQSKPATRIAVQAEGHTFPSVAKFCSYYGLKYVSVLNRIRQGASGDEILETVTPRPARGTEQTQKCVFEGEEYPSLSAAADALGVSVWKVYSAKQNSSLSPEAALQKAIDMEETELPSQGREKCVVAGKEYKTKREAVLAYGATMSTITSRMQRNGVTFEEALLQWKKSRTRIVGDKSTLWDFNKEDIGEEIPLDEILEDSIVAKTVECLQRNGYDPVCYKDIATEHGWICYINPIINVSSSPIDIYIFCSETRAIKDIELLAFALSSVPKDNEEAYYSVLNLLNQYNGMYNSIKVWEKNGMICASTSYPITTKIITGRLFIRYLHRLMGTAEAVRNELSLAAKTDK